MNNKSSESDGRAKRDTLHISSSNTQSRRKADTGSREREKEHRTAPLAKKKEAATATRKCSARVIVCRNAGAASWGLCRVYSCITHTHIDDCCCCREVPSFESQRRRDRKGKERRAHNGRRRWRERGTKKRRRPSWTLWLCSLCVTDSANVGGCNAYIYTSPPPYIPMLRSTKEGLRLRCVYVYYYICGTVYVWVCGAVAEASMQISRP